MPETPHLAGAQRVIPCLVKSTSYLADDHMRLDALLERAASHSDGIEPRHTPNSGPVYSNTSAMEEKILLPAAQRLRGGGAASHRGETAAGSRCSCRPSRAYSDAVDCHGYPHYPQGPQPN